MLHPTLVTFRFTKTHTTGALAGMPLKGQTIRCVDWKGAKLTLRGLRANPLVSEIRAIFA